MTRIYTSIANIAIFNPHQTNRWQIGLILILGLLLRLGGIQHGLPYVYDPDEPIFMWYAEQIVVNKDLNPHWFGHPGSTTIYLLAILYASIFIIGYLAGNFQTTWDLRLFCDQDPTLIYLLSRGTMLVFGVVTVLLVFLLARRLFSHNTALLAAGILAITPLHVHYSKFVRTDIQATFWVVLAFWFCLNIVEKGCWRDYLLAGAMTGIATATKYPAALIFASIIIAHLLIRNWDPSHQIKLISSGLASFAAMFASSPYLFLDYRTTLSNISDEIIFHPLAAERNTQFFKNLVWYLQVPLAKSFTWIGLILIGTGIILCFRQRQKSGYLLASFPIIFLLFISSNKLYWERWVIIALPFLSTLLAYAATETVQWISQRWRSMPSGWVYAAWLLIIIIPLFVSSLKDSVTLATPDTRTLAAEWILNNIPPGSNLAVEWYSPSLPKEAFNYFYINDLGNLVRFDPQNYYKKLYTPYGKLGDINDLQSIQDQDIAFIVMSNLYDRYLLTPKSHPEIIEKYEAIMELGKLVFSARPEPWKTQGVTIRIYQVKTR
ncbi:MAG: glycosyltransferase family 39 protein [Chloroflexota bacterium]